MNTNVLSRLLLILCLASPLLDARAAQESTYFKAEEAESSQLVKLRLQALTAWPYLMAQEISQVELINEVYRQHQFQPVWQNYNTLDSVIVLLNQAELDGLSPQDYYLEALQQAIGPEQAIPPELDILITAAVVKLAQHLHQGKLNPNQFEPHWQAPPSIDATAFSQSLLRQIKEQDLASFLAQQAPSFAFYQALKKALLEYQTLAKQTSFEPISLSVRSLKPNMQSAAIPQIKQRLRDLNHLPQGENQFASWPDSDLLPNYGPELVEPVKAFQRQHGLEPDGIIGPATLAALNVSYQQRVQLIKANLERARWLNGVIESPDFILVNAAAYQLTLYRQQQAIWHTKVVVGTPRQATPVFHSSLSYLEFNPTWSVPRSILREMWPKILQDPDYLTKQHFRVLTRQGYTVSLSEQEWLDYTPYNFPYFLQQQPWQNNALGQVKFIFPNRHSVFLHDTPEKRLFNRSQRNFSHGCIRVEQPLELARLLLNQPTQWHPASIEELVNTEKRTRIHVQQPIQVFITYLTVSAGELSQGEPLQFHPDNYQKDAAMMVYF